jgi:ABC-type branched-subunit amino acid transport system substrate-binding protein
MTKLIYILSIYFFLFNQDVYTQQKQTTSDKSIKIGLLISNSKSTEAIQAAEMAIDNANKKVINNGFYFQLVVKSMEGSWGTGSKQAVDLIYKDNVWAILGSHDSKNAHLVEQVIAKMHTVFLSAWASDPTLSYANVPWFFSCVPNDNQQKVEMPTSENQFVKDYQKKYHQAPKAVASYAFDGMNILIEAIKNSNFNREKLQKKMTKTHYKGVTGLIEFDKNGSRLGRIDSIETKNEKPLKVEK